MLTPIFWMVRAGERGFRFDDFKEKSLVSVGWLGVGDMSSLHSRADFKQRLTNVFPDWSPYEVGNSAGQLFASRVKSKSATTSSRMTRRHACTWWAR